MFYPVTFQADMMAYDWMKTWTYHVSSCVSRRLLDGTFGLVYVNVVLPKPDVSVDKESAQPYDGRIRRSHLRASQYARTDQMTRKNVLTILCLRLDSSAVVFLCNGHQDRPPEMTLCRSTSIPITGWQRSLHAAQFVSRKRIPVLC